MFEYVMEKSTMGKEGGVAAGPNTDGSWITLCDKKYQTALLTSSLLLPPFYFIDLLGENALKESLVTRFIPQKLCHFSLHRSKNHD